MKAKECAFLKPYRFGVDLWAWALVGLLLLPNAVSWILTAALTRTIPPYSNPYARNGVNVAAAVVLGASLLVLLSTVRDDRPKFSFLSYSGTFVCLFLLLYYVAWVFYFCAYVNRAVRVFLALCPSLCLLCYEFGMKHYIAAAPTAAFALLHLIATVIRFF